MSLLSGLLKTILKAGKSAKVITTSKNPIKVFKEVSKITDPIVDAALPKAVISTAKPVTGPRKLVKFLLPKDPAKTILKVAEPKPLTEAQKLGKTIEKFKVKYPKGLKIQETDQIKLPRTNSTKLMVVGGVAISSTTAALIAKNKIRK